MIKLGGVKMNHINYFADYKMNNVVNQNSNIEDTETGFLKGNMFKDLYNQYKNYQPQMISPTNEKERLMYEIQMYNFGMNDLVLYLDTNPKDQNALVKFSNLQDEYKRAVRNYENRFGPINLTSDSLDRLPWPWLKNWPFGGRN